MKQLILLLSLTTGFITWSQVPNYVPSDGLVGWWPFNGNADDESGNGNNGTNNGATLTTDRFGNADAAYDFDGNSTFISVQSLDNSNLNDITVSGWFNTNGDNSDNQVIFNIKNGRCWIPISDVSKIMGANFHDNNGNNPLSETEQGNLISVTTWHHFSIVTTGITMKLYFDGVLVDSSPTIQGYNDIYGFTEIGASGRSNDIRNNFFNGKLDDIGIWNRALTECEIQDLYNAELNSIQIGAITSSVDCSSGVGNAVVNITQPNSTQYTYSIDNLPFQNSSMFSDITPGNHSVIIKDIYNCDSDTITVNTNCGIPVFDCLNCMSNGDGLYQVYSDQGIVGSVDVVNNNYTSLPNSPSGTTLNAIGYNPEDSLAYGIISATSNLFVLDASGQYYDLGNISGLPNFTGSSAYTAGDFDNNGFLHVKKSNSNDVIYKINVKTLSLESTYNLSSSLYIGDLVFNPTNNKFYTIGVNQTENLYSFSPDVGILTNNGNTNLSGSVIGAMFTDATGRLWGIDNVTGKVYLIDTQNASTSLVAQVTVTNLNDGFSCRNAVINLNIIQETDVQSACDEYTWADGNTYTADNAVANYSEVNILGCDSIVYNLDLTILNSSSSTDTQEECDEFTWIDGNTYTEGNNTAMFVIPNAVGCDSTITLNLTINNLTTLDAGTDQTVCEGSDVILTATGAAVYDWEDGIQNGVSFSAELGSNTYTVEGTDANGCEDEQSVTITGAAYPELTFEVTDPACQGEASGNAVVVASNGTSPYTFVWNNGALQAENNGIAAGTYEVTVMDNIGCETQGVVVVIDPSEPCFNIPGGISPNGDGINDTWMIGGLSKYPDAKVNVFDRWGQSVYSGNATNDAWDGTINGNECPTADYYYILELGDEQKFNGVVTLKR